MESIRGVRIGRVIELVGPRKRREEGLMKCRRLRAALRLAGNVRVTVCGITVIDSLVKCRRRQRATWTHSDLSWGVTAAATGGVSGRGRGKSPLGGIFLV